MLLINKSVRVGSWLLKTLRHSRSVREGGGRVSKSSWWRNGGVGLPLVSGPAPLLPALEAGQSGVQVALPHLLFKVQDHVNRVVHDSQLRHGLVRLHVWAAYSAQLLQGVVDVTDTNSFSLVVAPTSILVLFQELCVIMMDQLGISIEDLRIKSQIELFLIF